MRALKFSVVVPVLNCVGYIDKCLKSVLSQDYQPREVIVIDGGSTDGTLDVIGQYRQDLACLVSESDTGQTSAINKGFSKATGDVLSWINADEEYLPGTLRKIGTAISENGADLCFGNTVLRNEDHTINHEIRHPRVHPRTYVLWFNGLYGSDASFWTKELHGRTGVLDEVNFPRLYMDVDWLLRLTLISTKAMYLDVPLSRRTDREQAITNSSVDTSIMAAYNEKIYRKMCQSLCIPYPVYYWIVRRFVAKALTKLSPRLQSKYRAMREMQKTFGRFDNLYS